LSLSSATVEISMCFALSYSMSFHGYAVIVSEKSDLSGCIGSATGSSLIKISRSPPTAYDMICGVSILGKEIGGIVNPHLFHFVEHSLDLEGWFGHGFNLALRLFHAFLIGCSIFQRFSKSCNCFSLASLRSFSHWATCLLDLTSIFFSISLSGISPTMRYPYSWNITPKQGGE